MVELGRALGLETLAEGIEDREQLEALRGERCERGQGFLFARPLPPDAVERIVAGVEPAAPTPEAIS